MTTTRAHPGDIERRGGSSGRWVLAAATSSLIALASGPAAAESPADPPSPALCDEDPPCRSHRNSAMRLYESKQYRDALAEFAAAYELRPEPRLLLNIGRSLFRLGRPRSALLRYEEYKRLVPEPEPEARDSIERYIKEAKATVGTFADSENEHPPVAAGAAASPSSVLRPLLPPLLIMGGGVLFLLAGIGTGAASASTASQFDAASRGSQMWTPEVAGLYSSGRTLDAATAGLLVTGIIITVGGGVWLGTKLYQRRAPVASPAALEPAP